MSAPKIVASSFTHELHHTNLKVNLKFLNITEQSIFVPLRNEGVRTRSKILMSMSLNA